MDREVVLRRDERQRDALSDEAAQRHHGLQPAHPGSRHDDAERVLIRMWVPRHPAKRPVCAQGRHPGAVAGFVRGNY
jgi:hypothetical protein